MALDKKAAELLSRGWYKERLEEAECEYLLSFRDRSPVANLAVALADRLNQRACTGTGQICAAIAVATGPCPCDCGFCRYGESRTKAKFYDVPDAQLTRWVQEIEAFADVRQIMLMTTGDADLEGLARCIGLVKDAAPVGTQIVLDTRDLQSDECRELKEAGATGARHARRLGEGQDTRLKAADRLQTIDNLVRAGFTVTAGIEPLGPEHTPAEIGQAFYEILDRRCCHADVTARVPVVGTRFNAQGELNPARLAQIKAVLTLASSWYNQPIREAFPGAFVTGANLATVWYGDEGVADAPKQNTVENARRRLFNAGYDRLLRPDGNVTELDLGYLKRTGSV